MKAAFRGLRRKASAGDVELRRNAQLAAEREEASVPQVPRLPDLDRSSPMPSLRFSALGLDNLVSDVGMHPSSSSALQLQLDHYDSPPGSDVLAYGHAVVSAPDALRDAGRAPRQCAEAAPPPLRAFPRSGSESAQLYTHHHHHRPLDSHPASELSSMPRAYAADRADCARPAAGEANSRSSRARTNSNRGDPYQDVHLLGADHEDDNDSIEAVRNNYNNVEQQHAPSRHLLKPTTTRSIRRSFSQPVLDDRHAREHRGPTSPVPSQQRFNHVPVAAGAPAKSSVSIILGSAKKAMAPAPSHSSTLPVQNDPPTAPSLFAYESGSGSGIKDIGKFKTISGRISTKGAADTKDPEREIVRNARGEIDWKVPPPVPVPTAQHLSGLTYQHQAYQAQQRGIPIEALGGANSSRGSARPRSRSVGKAEKRIDTSKTGARSPGPRSAGLPGRSGKVLSPKVPFEAIGTASNGSDANALRSPKTAAREGLRGMAASISSSKLLRMGSRRPRPRQSDASDSFVEISREDVAEQMASEDGCLADEHREAEQWEREREARNAADRLEVAEKKRLQLQQEEEAQTKRKREEKERREREQKEQRERERAEAAEQERIAKEKRAAEKAARREAKACAEREAEERRQQEEKEAEERRIKRAKAAEEKRLARQKEEEERREREAREPEELRLQQEKAEEERRVQEQKEAEERKAHRAEEKRRKREEAEREKARKTAEEEARRKCKRLEAIEAEVRAQEEAKQQEAEAKELADARRQVHEEDRLARKAGRREARRRAKALAKVVQSEKLKGSDPDEDEPSEVEPEVFADAEDMARLGSDARPPSSVESSADFPVTPAEEALDVMQTQANGKWRPTTASDRDATGSFKEHVEQPEHATEHAETPAVARAKNPEESGAYRSNRFDAAIKGSARRTAPIRAPELHQGPKTEEDDGDLDDQIVQPNGPYREGGLTYGRGWCAHGLADPSLLISHRRIVRTLRPVASTAAEDIEESSSPVEEVSFKDAETEAEVGPEANTEPSADTEPNVDNTPNPESNETADGGPNEGNAEVDAQTDASDKVAAATTDAEAPVEQPEQAEQEKPEYDEAVYSDLGELIWSSTTPDVIARLVSHLDYADIKALRQTSQSIRFALGQLAGREIVLTRFLGQVGYQTWNPTWTSTDPDTLVVSKDPLPLSFSDCEAFLLSYDLQQEYHLVGTEYAKAPHKVDHRYPRLARATTRSYNRVLARLRMQPTFKPSQPMLQHTQLSPVASQVGFVQASSAQTRSPYASPALGFKGTVVDDGRNVETISSPWRPGRAALFRVWVPSTEEGGWLSDSELSKCERELFIAGVWSFMQRGDVVWDCAVGDERNVGKYLFDGRYLRDLSYVFDRSGHLPSWVNSFSYPPSYYHNIIRSSSAAQPVVYLDVLPWRDQIVTTMRLVQDQVETYNPQGARYRISKWLYRAVINVAPGQIISDEGLEVVDAGWHGRIVIETEGTAEHAKELISRCAGPAESAQIKARLLASVMDADGHPRIPKAPAPTRNAAGQRIETTTPWAIIRARSRPGMIWIRPIDVRERVGF
ncbi:hypothetical protein ACQY0O_006390 [Thecaphora frezii]